MTDSPTEFKWGNNFAEQLIQSCELTVGGITVSSYNTCKKCNRLYDAMMQNYEKNHCNQCFLSNYEPKLTLNDLQGSPHLQNNKKKKN